MPNTAYIISGGDIDENLLLSEMKKRQKNDIIVAADAGLRVLDELDISPDLILGDFDSLEKEILEKYSKTIEISRYKSEKDFSDTELAVEICKSKGFNNITILGCFGGRMDHSLANINLLYKYHKEDIYIRLVDKFNRLYLIAKSSTVYKKDMWGKYLSVFPMGGAVNNFSISGVKYPLKNVVLDKYENPSLTISNEILDKECNIEFDNGVILVVESKDN